MTRHSKPDASHWRRAALGAFMAGAFSIYAGGSHAGECPASSRVADGQGQKPGPTMPQGLADVVRASTDLSKEPLALNGRLFRIRQLDLMPGGIVPWHSNPTFRISSSTRQRSTAKKSSPTAAQARFAG